jgi:hypothetical protein
MENSFIFSGLQRDSGLSLVRMSPEPYTPYTPEQEAVLDEMAKDFENERLLENGTLQPQDL